MKPTAHQMASMLNDYFSDPNCWPELWIQDAALDKNENGEIVDWDEDSKRKFCQLVNQIKKS